MLYLALSLTKAWQQKFKLIITINQMKGVIV